MGFALRELTDLLSDMRDACEQVHAYVARGGDAWMSDRLFVDAVVRNLEILGEAERSG